MTAGLHGWRALAVSLDCGWEPSENPRWDAVAHVLPGVLDTLLGTDDGTVLNLNVPDLPPADLAELREARLAAFGAVQVRVDHRTGDDGQALHLSGAELSGPSEPGTDIAREYNRQREYLEKSVELLKRKLLKDSEVHRQASSSNLTAESTEGEVRRLTAGQSRAEAKSRAKINRSLESKET